MSEQRKWKIERGYKDAINWVRGSDYGTEKDRKALVNFLTAEMARETPVDTIVRETIGKKHNYFCPECETRVFVSFKYCPGCAQRLRSNMYYERKGENDGGL